MGVRGKVVDGDGPDLARAKLKQELFQKAIREQNLSWCVKRFSGDPERWACLTYELDQQMGTLVVTDRDTDCDVMVYAKAGVDWHTLHLEYQPRIATGGAAWEIFTPEISVKTHNYMENYG